MAAERAEVVLAFGEVQRHGVGLGVEFVGAAQCVRTDGRGKSIVLAENECAGAGPDADELVGRFEFGRDGRFECGAAQRGGEVFALEADAGCSVVPVADDGQTGQFAFGSLVGEGRADFGQQIRPILRRSGFCRQPQHGGQQ